MRTLAWTQTVIRLLLLMLALHAPLLGAQSLLPAATVVSGDSGSLQLEAVWLLGAERPSASPLERLVAPGSLPSQHVGLRSSASPTPSFGASLTLDRGTPAMALLCRSGAPLVSLGAMAEHCLLAQIDAPVDLMGGLLRSGQAEISWNEPTAGLDLSFGLFWLQGQNSAFALGSSLPLAGLGWASPPQVPNLRGVSFGATKSFIIGDELKLVLGGSLARQEMRLPGLISPLESSFLDLNIALENGAFSGILNSRHYQPGGGAARWQAIDLGIAWRTPWQGQLSFGARNLLGKRSPPSLTPSQALGFGAQPDLMNEPSQGRVPFVRYRQDL